MKRLIRETEKPSFPAQCRVLAEAAVLWALLAAGAQLLLPAEKTALPEGAALAWAALRICLVTPLAEELAFRGGALYLLQPLGGALGRDRLGAGAADGHRAESVGLRHLRRTLRIQPRADGHCIGDGVL